MISCKNKHVTECWNCPFPILEGAVSSRFCDDCFNTILLGSVTGDGEYWINHPKHPTCLVSSFGRVKRKGKILAATPNDKGYLMVTMPGRRRRLHQVVLESFVGAMPMGFGGLHFDDDRTNNKLFNLYWGDAVDNYRDAVRNRGGVRPGPKPTPCVVDGCPEPARWPGATCVTHHREYKREVAARALALRAAI